LLLLAIACGVNKLRQPAVQPPESLDDLADIADALGLFHRSDLASGEVTGRLVVSDRPVTFERASQVRIGVPDHPCWHGTVAATEPSNAYVLERDTEHQVVWGSVCVYGDPALIRKLMTARRRPGSA
jgi:hypothetical protein